jgi:hypothetical protein
MMSADILGGDPVPLTTPAVPTPAVAEKEKPAQKDGSYRSGDEVVFVVDGERWIVPPFDDADLDVVETFLKKQRRPALDAMGSAAKEFESLPPAMKEGLLDRLYRDLRKSEAVDQISRQEVADWLDTFDGLAFSMFLQLRKRYPSITQEKARYIVRRVGVAETMRIRDKAAQNLTEILGVTSDTSVAGNETTG